MIPCLYLVLLIFGCSEKTPPSPDPIAEGHTYFNLGLNHAQFRRFPEAISAYEQAAKLLPEGSACADQGQNAHLWRLDKHHVRCPAGT